MSHQEQGIFGEIVLTGQKTYTGATAAAAVTVYVLFKDWLGDILFCTGLTVPTDDQVGYAMGCLFIDTDVADGTSGLYTNIGTNLLCEFSLVTSASAS